MIYIVTASAMYYPMQGAGDWIYVGADITAARRAFAGSSRDGGVSLIGVSADGYRILDMK